MSTFSFARAFLNILLRAKTRPIFFPSTFAVNVVQRCRTTGLVLARRLSFLRRLFRVLDTYMHRRLAKKTTITARVLQRILDRAPN